MAFCSEEMSWFLEDFSLDMWAVTSELVQRGPQPCRYARIRAFPRILAKVAVCTPLQAL